MQTMRRTAGTMPHSRSTRVAYWPVAEQRDAAVVLQYQHGASVITMIVSR